MCKMVDVGYIPAASYFYLAKRKNRELKRLRSVSRAYRKSCVRAIKETAARRLPSDQVR